jgi:hypothetical protein
MDKQEQPYRMVNDDEPEESDLLALMHEVAVEADKKHHIVKQELQNNIRLQISKTLIREGYFSG